MVSCGTKTSIRGFCSLIEKGSQEAAEKENQIDDLIVELKNGNFDNIEAFHKLIKDLLFNVLENIKHYAEQDASQKIEVIARYFNAFFNYHLFEMLKNQDILEIKREFDKNLKQLIIDLKQGQLTKTLTAEADEPIHLLFKRITKNSIPIERKTEKKPILCDITNEDSSIQDFLTGVISLSQKKERLEDSEKEYIKDSLIRFTGVLLTEFEALFEAEKDAIIQEASLIQDINDIIEIAKKKNNTDAVNKLKLIKGEIGEYCNPDFNSVKRMIWDAKSLKSQVDEKLSEANKSTSN